MRLVSVDLSARGGHRSRQSRQQRFGHHYMGLCICRTSKFKVMIWFLIYLFILFQLASWQYFCYNIFKEDIRVSPLCCLFCCTPPGPKALRCARQYPLEVDVQHSQHEVYFRGSDAAPTARLQQTLFGRENI